MKTSLATAIVMLTLAASQGAILSAAPQAQKLPVTWTASPAAVRGAAGETVRVEITATIAEGWHLYSLTQVSPPDPTVIAVPDGQPFSLGGTIEGPVPETGFDEAQGATTEYYTEAVTFRIPVVSKGTTAPGDYKARITARWTACNGSLCLRPQVATLDVPVQIVDKKYL